MAESAGRVLVCTDVASPLRAQVYCSRACWRNTHRVKEYRPRVVSVKWPGIDLRSARNRLKAAAYGRLSCAKCGGLIEERMKELYVAKPDWRVCSECGSSRDNVVGCRACCRDCGMPCNTEKDGEGFHADQDA